MSTRSQWEPRDVREVLASTLDAFPDEDAPLTSLDVWGLRCAVLRVAYELSEIRDAIVSSRKEAK